MTIAISKKTMIIAIALIILVGGIFLFGSSPEKGAEKDVAGITSGLPVVSILVKAGYTPSVIKAPANERFILRLTTRNTYDCSAALAIPDLKVDQFLKPTGETDIVVDAQKPGTVISGGCSMGMYGFQIMVE